MIKVKLGDVAREHKETLKTDKSEMAIVGLEHLIPGYIRLMNWDQNKENTFTKVFRKGNVLFGRRRAYLKKAAYAEIDGICSGDITVIEAIPGKISTSLLPFIIQNDKLFDFAVGKSAGSLSPRVKWEDLKEFEFDLPDSIEEQNKLAELLWSMVETSDQYRSLMQKTDDLVKSQFIEQMKQWNLNGEGQKYNLGDLVRIRTGKLDANASVDDGKYPFFTCSRQPLRIDSYSYDCECVLVAGNGELNVKYYDGKFDAYQRTYIIESKDKGIVKVPYLYRFLANYVNELQEQAVGGIIKYIKMENLTNAQIIVPSLNEQDKLLDFIEQSDKSKFSYLIAEKMINRRKKYASI